MNFKEFEIELYGLRRAPQWAAVQNRMRKKHYTYSTVQTINTTRIFISFAMPWFRFRYFYKQITGFLAKINRDKPHKIMRKVYEVYGDVDEGGVEVRKQILNW